MSCSLMHFEQGVPIDDLDLRTEHRTRLARVSHVYWIWKRNPFLDVFPMFKQLVKGKGADVHTEWEMARKDKILFDFIVEHIAPPSRRVAEERVRNAANHLMEMGMQTDNGRDIAEGAKIAIKIDRLDQPESDQADMSKANFLQPVVTTIITDVDSTKIDYNDTQSLAIMKEFGAYIDPKRQMIDDKVALIEAKDTDYEQTGDESGNEQ